MESSNGNLRGDLLQRKTFDTLLEANGALRAMAAAHQYDPTTQRLGVPAQAPPGVAVLCVRLENKILT